MIDLTPEATTALPTAASAAPATPDALISCVRPEFAYRVCFTRDLLATFADTLAPILNPERGGLRLLPVVDDGLLVAPDILSGLEQGLSALARRLGLVVAPIEIIPGGEICKNDPAHLQRLYESIFRAGLCRHSYVLAIGGGALLDVAGYAAATAHRGVRIVRVPTTVLAQDDAGVGVKNSVNAFGRKNFLGTFAPPHAVVCDQGLLRTLSDRDWRAGMSEAVKVAMIKDGAFFAWLEANADALVARDDVAMQRLVRRSAELHVTHIASAGDPFEMGSARPLDFGHWAAHKLEQLTGYALRHGEAVAVGMTLDTAYAAVHGMIGRADAERLPALLRRLKLPTTLEVGAGMHLALLGSRMRGGSAALSISGQGPGLLRDPVTAADLLAGLDEFREHLGGELCITLPTAVGKAEEVHAINESTMRDCLESIAG